jgi:hypothetical protein
MRVELADRHNNGLIAQPPHLISLPSSFITNIAITAVNILILHATFSRRIDFIMSLIAVSQLLFPSQIRLQ